MGSAAGYEATGEFKRKYGIDRVFSSIREDFDEALVEDFFGQITFVIGEHEGNATRPNRT
jgi:hypothetical protein